jgi:hypothetical protein
MAIEEQRILLLQAQPGMVLARDVNQGAQVKLCGKGTVLTGELLQQLDIRGIKRIVVQGRPIAGPTAAQKAEEARQLAERFARVQDQPAMVELQRAVERLMRKRWAL